MIPADLKPERVFYFFNQINQIPRPSGKEEKMTDYLVNFAKERGLFVYRDKVNNVIMRKPAAKGMEQVPSVVLQGHQDMVCEKDPDVNINFETDAIQTELVDGFIRAKGTTLGGDDGIGVAMALAILDDDSLQLGQIETLFTVDEERGLMGAKNVEAGILQSKLMINLDSETEGEIFMGCAGGQDLVACFKTEFEPLPKNWLALEISLTHLHGGHSGDDIEKGYGNANQILAQFLKQAKDRYGLRLCSFTGGNLRNAIPRDATAVCCVPFEHREHIRVDFNIYAAQMQEQYTKDPDARYIMQSTTAENMLCEQISADFIECLANMFNGVLCFSNDCPGLVETSSNLASVRMENDCIRVVTSQRSLVYKDIFKMTDRIAETLQNYGATVERSNDYPGWTPNPQSFLLKRAKETYLQLFGKPIEARAIHAGLECGLFTTKYPNLDIISIGPNVNCIHSPAEALEVASVERVFRHVLAILTSLTR